MLNRVVSGSRDATLRVWDIIEGKCLQLLVGHLAAVRCVQYDGKLVVSGAYDYMVKVWNPERQECLHTLQGHTNRVYSLQVCLLDSPTYFERLGRSFWSYNAIISVWRCPCCFRFVGYFNSCMGRWDRQLQTHTYGSSEPYIGYGITPEHFGVRQCRFNS